MSAEPMVTVTRTEDDQYAAVDAETGEFRTGESMVGALLALEEHLETLHGPSGADRDSVDETETGPEDDPVADYRRLSSQIQQRVQEDSVDEDVVEDAIRWARSE